MIEKMRAEILLAEIIDDLYLEMKENFVDYESKTHKLGQFKERIKGLFHEKIAVEQGL